LRSKCLCAGDIAKHFELTGATISHHLKVLAEGNLITSKKVGLEIYYSLNIEKYNVLIISVIWASDIEVLYPDIECLRHVSPLTLHQVKTKSETFKSIER